MVSGKNREESMENNVKLRMPKDCRTSGSDMLETIPRTPNRAVQMIVFAFKEMISVIEK